MKAVIELDVPEWQIGQPVTVYFKDTMCKRGVCENAAKDGTKKLKVLVTHSSKPTYDGEVREYKDLEVCVKDLLENENYFNNCPEVVIGKIRDDYPDWTHDCKYEVEVYDTWRE